MAVKFSYFQLRNVKRNCALTQCECISDGYVTEAAY